MLTYVDMDALKPLKLVVNAGNGCAGIAIDGLEGHLPFEFVKLHHEPDGTFPGLPFPNPEEPGAMDMAHELAGSLDADLVLANDPDADRLGRS